MFIWIRTHELSLIYKDIFLHIFIWHFICSRQCTRHYGVQNKFPTCCTLLSNAETGQNSYYHGIIIELEIEKYDKEYQSRQAILRKGFKKEGLCSETLWIRSILDWRLGEKTKQTNRLCSRDTQKTIPLSLISYIK